MGKPSEARIRTLRNRIRRAEEERDRWAGQPDDVHYQRAAQLVIETREELERRLAQRPPPEEPRAKRPERFVPPALLAAVDTPFALLTRLGWPPAPDSRG